MAIEAAARILLLVEDNPADAALVSELVANDSQDAYEVIHVTRLSEAMEPLLSRQIDVIVLDLRLPDASGVESVKALRGRADQVPIVVLSGIEDEELAQACIDAGAQDYLAKIEVHARNLRRAIGYAITRVREAQIRDLVKTLERYRTLSSASQKTTVTAALLGSGTVALRRPDIFQQAVNDYTKVLEDYLTSEHSTEISRIAMERIVTALGDANGGPRDLLDVHVKVLDRAIDPKNQGRTRTVLFEARLLALEMMGLLVDYYRVGHRRIYTEGWRQ